MRIETKLVIVLYSFMIASSVYASDTTTKFQTGDFTVKFDLGAPCSDINISKPIHQELLSGAQNTYIATASNKTIYFAFIHLNETNFDTIPYLASDSIRKDLLELGAIEDSIVLYPLIINEKPGVVGKAYIPANEPTEYQARYKNLLPSGSGAPPHVQIVERCSACWLPSKELYPTYVPARNSTEYQARFSISDNDFGIVGSTGNETRMKSLLKTLNVTVPIKKKPKCQPFDFDMLVLSCEGEFCPTTLKLAMTYKVVGIDYGRVEYDFNKKAEYCYAIKLGVIGDFVNWCFGIDKKGRVYTTGTARWVGKSTSWNETIAHL